MTLYGTALFLHIVFAILLVGGSAWIHVAVGMAKRAPSVETARAHVNYIAFVSKASMPLAVATLVAGVYLAFDGGWWGAGWPVISLVLFLGAGATAGGVVDPKAVRLKALVDETPSGPVTAEVRAAMTDPTLRMCMWVLGGIDAAIVALMTNKPGYVGSLLVVGVAMAVGAILGVRENRHRDVPWSPPLTSAPLEPRGRPSTRGSSG